jgi:hypothetical protein
MKSGLAFAVTLVGFCGPACADQIGPYVYGSFGKAQASINKGAVDAQVSASQGGAKITSSATGNPTAYKLNVGYQFGYNAAFEFGYTSTNSLTYSTSAPVAGRASEKLQIWDLVFAGNRIVGAGLSLTFRGGVADVRASSSGAITNFGSSKFYVAGGAGIKYAFGENLSVRVDWDTFSAPGRAQLGQFNLFTAGIGYHF